QVDPRRRELLSDRPPAHGRVDDTAGNHLAPLPQSPFDFPQASCDACLQIGELRPVGGQPHREQPDAKRAAVASVVAILHRNPAPACARIGCVMLPMEPLSRESREPMTYYLE